MTDITHPDVFHGPPVHTLPGPTGAKALPAADLVSAPFVSRIEVLCTRAGTRVDLAEAEHWDTEEDEARYVAVSE
ncbi:hypothetical protein ACWD04_25215 [Streptomyces sp. NPDC002911]